MLSCTHLDGVIGVCDKGDEEAQDHESEERDEGVDIHSAEHPHQIILVSVLGEG